MELPIKVQGIVFKRTNNAIQYLLLKRIKEDGGFWQPMTGTLNDGESLENCLIRELDEETGIKEYARIIKNVGKFEWIKPKKGTMIEYVFGIEVDKNIEVKISDEHDDFEWCAIDEALKKLEKRNNRNAFMTLDKKLRE
jgi:8-oxo-dGTP pyrophosphatase MutT (NUDIX family)